MKSAAWVATGTCVLLAAFIGLVHAQQKIPAYLSAAIADPGRPDTDTKRDIYYNPAAVIAFAGVKPGVKVADFLIWDGYYSRIFSKITGPKGFVYAYYVTQEDGVRPKSGPVIGGEFSSMSNVGIIHAPAEQFVTPERVDMVWIGMSYHDLHNTSLFKGLDVAGVNKAIFASLKPGGTYVVLDRAAKPGSGLEGLSLSRIDEATVKSEIEAAGFKLVGESNVMRDPGDDHTKRVTKPQYDVKADEFLLKFQKPR